MSALTLNQAVTLSSLDLVDFINSERAPSEPELRHDHFMAKVPKVLGDAAPTFMGTVQRPQPAGGFRDYPCYRFPKREACLMAMSYSYSLQAKVFDRMTELEAAQAPKLPQTMAQALRLAADQAEKLEALALELQAAQPAVEFVGHYVEAGNDKSFREVAKILGIKQNHFFADLSAAKIIFKQGRNWLPFAHHQDAGRFTVKTGVAGDHAFTQTRFTPEGIAWIARRYAKASNDAAFVGVGVK